jgi:hypothetical protein
MRRSLSRLVPLAALALLSACQDGTVTGPLSSGVPGIPSPLLAAIDEGPVSYFAPRTISREGTGMQIVQFPLNDRDHSQFMEPFVLHVRGDGDQRVVGIVRVDGVPVLERRDLVALGASAAPVSREVAITASSIVTVELQGPPGGSLTFWVDAPLQPPPVITITSPVRHAAGVPEAGQPGAFLQQGTLLPSPVEITGTACHVRYPITELEVAGVSVPVTGTNLCEPFSVTQQSRWGLSIITGTARNARGRVGTVVQSYARSPEYYESPLDAPGAVIIPGFFTRINQPALDDGNRATVNDIAGFLESRLSTLNAVIPPTSLVPCSEVIESRITGGRIYQSIRVHSIRSSAEGLAIDVSLLAPRLNLFTRAELNFFDGNCTGGREGEGSITASAIRFRATAVPSTTPTGEGAFHLTHIRVDVSDLNSDVGFPVADFLIDMISAAAQSFVGDFVVDLMTPTISDLLESFLPVSWQKDVPLNSAVMRVTGRLSAASSGGAAPNGFLQFGLSAQVEDLIQDPSVRATRGAIRALCMWELGVGRCPGGSHPVPPFSATAYEAAFSVHQDMFNAAFWAAWRAGAFNLVDVGALPLVGPLAAQSMSAQATLPPISMASGDDPTTYEMAWGDIRVRSTFDPATIGAPAGAPIMVESWVSAVVRANMAVDQAAGRLSMTDVTSEIHVQLITGTLGISDAAVRAAVEADVRAMITRLSRDALSIVPVDLSVRGLGTITAANVFRSNAYYLLTGNIE